jgi:hypothetical protein
MGKGGGGSTTTVDPAFNAGLLKIYQQESWVRQGNAEYVQVRRDLRSY